MPASGATGRLWSISGESEDLLRLSATLESGDACQVAACIPAAVALDGKENVSDEEVQQVLRDFPPLKSNHLKPVHLPNMVRKIVRTCFMPQRPSNRAIDPIGHVLNKAWPMRCSVRNFSDIVASYIERETSVYLFVCTVMHACMCGIYPTSQVKATLPLKLLLHRYYISQRVSQSHLAQWVRQGNHNIVFVAIKEYIAFAVSMVPGLASVLKQDYGWDEFVHSVTEQADTARSELNRSTHEPSEMFARALSAMACARVFKCPPPTPGQLLLCETLSSVIRTKCVPSGNVYKTPLRVQIYNAIKDVVAMGASMHKVARAVGISSSVVSILQDVDHDKPAPSAMRRLRNMELTHEHESLLLYEFIAAWGMCLRIHTYPLPAHVQAEQERSESKRSTTVFACACCKQVRAFVVDEGHAAGNAWARGHQKVLLDDETGVLYCGKRVEKAATQSRRLQAASDAGRSYWKAQQSLMCGYCPLVKIEMKGTLLSFYGKLYVLCPLCLCTMLVTPNRYLGGSLRCVNCRYKTTCQESERCFHCFMECDEMTSFSVSDDRTLYSCTSCTRWWMQDQEMMAKLDEETVHKAINERWSTNRLQVHCANV